MSQPFRVALLAFGALLLATAAVWVWRSAERPEDDLGPVAARGSTDEDGTPGLEAQGPSLEPAPAQAPARPGGDARPPARTPSGLDLSDPAQRKARLAELLAQRPVPWAEVASLLQLMEEPLAPEARAFLLETLRVGDRNGALTALRMARDATLLPDLFAIVDDPSAAAGLRRVTLQILGAMPAGERDLVVRELEARLKGSRSVDGAVLYAIADRGGGEAMRAVTEYALRPDQDAALAQTLVGRFDLAKDAAAQAVLAEALGRNASPAALETLVRLAGSPGADGLAPALIALDRDDQPMALREQVYLSLGQLGSADAVGHLLAVSRQPGQFGEHATLALANLPAASPAAREALLQELDRAGASPRSEVLRSSLLETLGRLGEPAALPSAVAALRDGSERVRNSALISLQGQGARGRAHVEEVSGLFLSGSPATRIAVVNALAAMGGPEAKKELEGFAKRSDLTPSLKRTLDVALGELHRRSAPAEGTREE